MNKRTIIKETPLIMVLVISAVSAGLLLFQNYIEELRNRPMMITVSSTGSESEATDENISLYIQEELSSPLPKDLETLFQKAEENPGEGVKALQAYGDKNPEIFSHTSVLLKWASLHIKAEEWKKAEKLLDRLPGDKESLARGFFRRGVMAFKQGYRSEAAEHYSRALSYMPDYYLAAYNLGTLSLGEGDYPQAVSSLETAVKSSGGERKARALGNLGIAYSRSGLFSPAEKAYTEAINILPSSVKIRINLALLYRDRLNDANKAIKLLEEVLALDKGNSTARIYLSDEAQKQGDLYRGENLLTEGLSLSPENIPLREALGRFYLVQNKTDMAERQFSRIAEKGDASAAARFFLGRIEYSKRQYEKAITHYKRAWEISEGTHAEAMNNLGLAWKEAGIIEEAKKAYKMALEAEPDYAVAAYNLGLLYLEEGELLPAQKSFEKSLTLNPLYSAAVYNLAVTYSRQGEDQRAIEAYQKVLQMDPSSEKARLNLALLFKKSGDTELAIEQYRAAVTLSPEYSSAWYNLALTHKEAGQIREAEEAYKKAIELEPENIKYLKNLAVLYSRNGQTVLAEKTLKSALETAPSDTGLLYNLSVLLKKEEREEQALKHLILLTQNDPENLKAWSLMAEIHYDKNRFNEAKKAYEEALKIDPGHGELNYQMAKTHYRMKQYSDAVAYYKTALEKTTDNPWIWYGLGKTYQAQERHSEAREMYSRSLDLSPSMEKYIAGRLEKSEDSVKVLKEMVLRQPESRGLKLSLAEALVHDGETEEAVTLLKNHLKENRHDGEVMALLGKIYKESDREDDAVSYYRDAVKAGNTDKETLLSLSHLLSTQKEYGEAAALLKTSLSVNGADYTVYTRLGSTLYDNKEYSKAAEAFMQAHRMAPDKEEPLLDLGKSYYRNKEYKESLIWFNRVHDKAPDKWTSIWKARAHARLKEWDSALNIYRQNSETYPGFIQSWIGMGDLYRTRENREMAILCYRKVLEIDPLHKATRTKLERLERTDS